ncbi:MAG: thioredoxin family protein [Candidatus Thiodiazotropha lotti]|nr:thioredoxin family protein [Candidatus Thiodiazotropha lotti]MCW4184424.1 thioredoxin family protein [Candidatus Thiodiazotropha weberae]
MIKKYLISMFLLFGSGLSVAESLNSNTNWADASALARQNHTVIMVVFESEDCGYCVRLKQEVLKPFSDSTEQNPPVIKEIDIYAGGKITDFNDDLIRSRQFKDRYQVFAVPTLLILDPEGNLLADPIVGYNSQEEYERLLQKSLLLSYEALD